MTQARPWCGFAWTSVGDDAYHECLRVGPHQTHRCSDDNCSAESPVAVKGGRPRQSHGRPG